jgi:diguanylate cyclase (GGDEF)-like protein
MNDKTIKNQSDRGVYSLRQRYLFVSTVIVLMIFAFAWLAQSYVSQSSVQHSQNIELRQQASKYIRTLRNEVLHTEKGLEAFMWEPSAANREGVHHGIERSLHYFELLRQHEWFTRSDLDGELGDFALDLKSLHITLDRVMDMRLDKLTSTPNFEKFHLNLNHASQHFTSSSDELRKISPTHFPLLKTTNLLWQQLQQHFQSFQQGQTSSLPESEQQFRQLKVEALHTQLDKMVGQFATSPEISNQMQHQLLREMQEAMNLWRLSYNEILNRNNSTRSNSEVHYLKHTVEPHFDHLWEYVKTLERHIDEFSKDDSVALNEVASTVAKMVWLLSFFGLTVITVAYLYFQGTVLEPITTVAAALKLNVDGNQIATLPQVHNLETRHLIDAYDEMRRQVNDRQQALEHIAMHDSLTGLPNRYHLMGNLQALCETSQQEGAIFSVMMLGLDRFKEINDTLGQQTGDIILKKVGQRLRILLRDHDSVARFASDEFAVLLLHTDREEALYVARKIISEMEQAFDIDGINLSVSCSIGISLFPHHGQDRDELTRRANIAMAIAKQHKTGISVYEERYDTSSVERISLAGKLRQALNTGALHLHYQPQFSAHNQRLSGLEVLCRWEDAERGVIGPEEFIPVAEQTGLIHALTEWVIGTTLRQAQQWRSKGLDYGIISINISAFNLHAPNFIMLLEKQLVEWDFPVEKLMLEVTETAMMADPEHAIRTLGEIEQLGLKLSIDDYGTGFSSLAYVKQLPVHELKIDKSFVMDMTHDENDAVIVRSTIDLAHNLGLKVVAEGVDTQEKQDLLEILDCDYLQGYHLGRPMPAEQIEQVLPLRKEPDSKIHHLRDFR